MRNYTKVSVTLDSIRYPVYIGMNIYPLVTRLIRSITSSNQVVIISVPPVSRLYLDTVRSVFNRTWRVVHLDVPDGERSKSIAVLRRIYDWLIRHRLERNCTIMPLGGGVIGDLAGFAAATYLRGVHLIHLPTSLLAQVDSSIGGKVGINHPAGKNLVGAFYQPGGVVTDVSVLNTLLPEEFICGLGEVIKYAIIDKELFEYLTDKLPLLIKRDPQVLLTTITQCVRIKSRIVRADEREQGIRAILNLGHTFGHALERFYDYRYLKHGQAVLLGLRSALHASRQMKLIKPFSFERILNLLDRVPVSLPRAGRHFNASKISEHIAADKKIRDGKINLILIKDIGNIIRKPIDRRDLLIRSIEILK